VKKYRYGARSGARLVSTGKRWSACFGGVSMNIRWNLGIGICLMAAFCGCGARRSAARGAEVAADRSSAGPFISAQFVAQPTLGPGSRYSDLLSPDSYAIWLTDEVAKIKLESESADDATPAKMNELVSITEQLNEKFLIFEVHVVSAFPDASIAYDVTGFRHVDVSLAGEGGSTYAPLQVIIGPLEREEQGALKKFRRVNLVIFPRCDLFTGQPLFDSRTAAFSLVISGYKTAYLFSWANIGDAPREAVSDEELQAIRARSLQRIEPVLRFLAENL
jgi:hypothetical protein